jgi:hypothetical protein
MADVFISYSRADQDRVRKLADAIEKSGLTVWWDKEISTGTEFRFEIARALESATVVVVIWSAHSVASRFVCDEADAGASRNALVPALLDLVDIPLGFRQIQTADLTRWHGKKKDADLQGFIDVIRSIAKGAPKRKVADVQPMGHEDEVASEPQPAVAPHQENPKKVKKQKVKKQKAPKQKAPRRRSRTRMVTGQRMRIALLWRSVMLTALIAGAFGALAYFSDFIFDAYRPYMIAAIAGLVFVSRYLTFQSDRLVGAASLHLLPRSYLALLFFAAISIAPFVLEGRMYAAALQAVRMEGIEGADINGVTFSSDGAKLVTSSDDKTARLWDANTGVELGIYDKHTEWVWDAGFSPDGENVVTASRDLSAQIWSTKNRKLVKSLDGHKSSVYDAAFAPNGQTIATASTDKTVRLWNVESGETIAVLSGHGDRVTALEFNRVGDTLATASYDNTVRLWRASNGTALGQLQAGQQLHDVAFNASGTQVAASGEGGGVMIWDVGNRNRVATFNAPVKQFGVRFVGEGLIAAGGLDGIIRVWNIGSKELVHELTGHEDAVRALDASLDGARLASASRDNTARIWDVATGDQIQIMGHITPALRLPQAIDLPPYLTASRAPIPLDIQEDRKKLLDLMVKGLGLAGALLFAGLILKYIFKLVRLERASNASVILFLGLPALYITALMISALPIQAVTLWATVAFLPAAIYAILRLILSRTISRKR